MPYHSIQPALAILLLRFAVLLASLSHAATVPAPVPVGPFLNGVFPVETPGTASEFTTVNAFPNLRFIGPLWVVPYPGSNDLVVVGKSGHVWRFENRADVLPSEVTVMLNLSKYGDGVDLPANVLPDAANEPAVVATASVASAPDMAFYQVIFHPDFGQAGQPGADHVYASYSYLPDLPGAGVDTTTYFRVSRFTVVDDPVEGPVFDPASELVLIDQYDANRNHQGGAMFFGPDGFLYISTGDGGYGAGYETAANTPSQRLDGALMGGILRIDVDMQGGSVSHPIRRHPDDSAMDPSVRPPSGWPASFSGNYYIPSDNPWVNASPASEVLEEFWAVGLRSPHSMQRDPVSGQIWIGEVGGSAEEIHLAKAGDNFQWRYVNGGGTPKPNPLIGTDSPAILTISRAVGTCVIGGFVYRGTEFPGLTGKLLYGDHVKGTVSSLDYTPGQAPVAEFLCGFSRIGSKAGLANFCEGPNGEVFMADLGGFDDASDIEDNDGTIQRLAAATTSPEPPALLSQTGAFQSLATLAPDPAFLPYDVLAPLWSDDAEKSRWIALPNNGTHNSADEEIVFSEKGNWVFPAGTVIMKHFELADDETDPSSTVRLETRFLVCTEGGGKYGITYRWLPDQSDAVLLTTGETGDYEIIEAGGGSRNQSWTFPSRIDCMQCHNDSSGQALGLRTHALNGDYTYPGGSGEVNQLVAWNHRGMFDQGLSELQIENFMKAVPLDDPDVPVEHRVRSYIDMNCSHCHQPGAPGGGFDGRLNTPLLAQSLINQEPGLFQDLYPDGRYIKPGSVANSIVHYRMDHALPAQEAMPPLAKNLVDSAAVQAVAEWIIGLDPADYPATPVNIHATLAGPASTTGDWSVTLVLDDEVAGLSAEDLAVSNGAVIELRGRGQYFIATIRPGGSPVTVSLPAATVTGTGTGLPNAASNMLVADFVDSNPPVAQFTGLPIDGVISGPVLIGLDFGKDVSGLALDDFLTVSGTIDSLSENNGRYSFVLSPSDLGEVRVDLLSGAVQDSLGRGNAAATLILQSVPGGAQLGYTSGLDVWLDGSDLDGFGNATLNDGEAVAGWVNKGTTGVNDGVVVGGGTSFGAGIGEGGQDGLVLDNTRHQFGQEWGDSADCTMYFVIYEAANSSAAGSILTDYGDTGPMLRNLRVAGGSAGAYMRDAGGDELINTHGGGGLADGKWAVVFYSFDSSSGISTWGELGSTSTASNPAYDPDTTFEGTHGGPVTLFSFHSGDSGHDFNGMVAEVLIYDHVLDEGRRVQVEAYLQAKTIPDVDADGISDEYELEHTVPASATALEPGLDDDGDGLTNLQEFLGLDANNVEHGFGQTLASVADSDEDGILDLVELEAGTDPNDSRSFPYIPPVGVVFQVDFENSINPTGGVPVFTQEEWAPLVVANAPNPTISDLSDTLNGVGFALHAGGGGIFQGRAGSSWNNMDGTNWNHVVEDAIAARNGDGTVVVSFGNLDDELTYKLSVWHNASATDSASFASGLYAITPSVTLGSLVGGPVNGQATNWTRNTVPLAVDNEFVNSVIRFESSGGMAEIVLTSASANQFLVMNGMRLQAEPQPEDPVIVHSAFNQTGGFEVTVSGLDTGRNYLLKRSADLADGFPTLVFGPFSPVSDTETVTDPAPPVGKAFYRIEQAP